MNSIVVPRITGVILTLTRTRTVGGRGAHIFMICLCVTGGQALQGVHLAGAAPLSHSLSHLWLPPRSASDWAGAGVGLAAAVEPKRLRLLKLVSVLICVKVHCSSCIISHFSQIYFRAWFYYNFTCVGDIQTDPPPPRPRAGSCWPAACAARCFLSCKVRLRDYQHYDRWQSGLVCGE